MCNVNISLFLLLMSALLITSSTSLVMPSSYFLKTFTTEFEIEGIRLVLPEVKYTQWNVLSLMRNFRYWNILKVKILCNLIVNTLQLIHFSMLGMTVSAVEEGKLDSNQYFEQNPKILYITAATTYNSKVSNNTMKVISHYLMKRKNSDKHIWLLGINISEKDKEPHYMYSFTEPSLHFVPVPHIKYSRLEHLFHGVHLDLDDDVYIYQVNSYGSKPYYQLYEVYKISDESVPVVVQVGNWSKGDNDSSLKLVKEDKIKRRNDLRVIPHTSL